MFLNTLNNDKIINSERIQEVRLTDEEYPTGWNDEGLFYGAYFIVIDVLNSKGKMETVFYEEFPILDADFADDYEYPKLMYGTKQEYLDGLAFEEAQEEMQKLCRKINRKSTKKAKKQVA